MQIHFVLSTAILNDMNIDGSSIRINNFTLDFMRVFVIFISFSSLRHQTTFLHDKHDLHLIFIPLEIIALIM